MTRGKRRLASRPSRARRLALVAAPLVTVAAVGTGVAATGPDGLGLNANDRAVSSLSGKMTSSLSQAAVEARSENRRASRSFDRAAVAGASTVRAPKPVGTRWTTEDLDIRTAPQEDAKTVGLIDEGKKVKITGVTEGAYAEIVVKGVARWVTAEYLDKEKPPADPVEQARTQGLSEAPCPDGSDIEGALQPQAVKVYRAACAAFPELTTYGGQDGHGEHVNGEAIDFMVPDHATGERLKDFLYEHHEELGLFDIIWAQHIWTIERSGEGFRPMSDRGSPTANHYDHVHIKIL